MLSKVWVWDPGSEIRDPEKTYSGYPDPGVKKAPDPGSGSATLDPGSGSATLDPGSGCATLDPGFKITSGHISHCQFLGSTSG
jgi:hypothetical protein